MLKLIYFIITGYLLYSLINQFVTGITNNKKTKANDSNNTSLIRDPFCDTFIIKKDAIKKRIGNKTFYFCSDKCVDGFKKRLKEANKRRQR
ncbi:MAG: hypothetical protein ACE5EA_01490 [Nitrospirota bacterium]